VFEVRCALFVKTVLPCLFYPLLQPATHLVRDTKAMCYRLEIVLELLSNCFVIAVNLPCDRFAIVVKSRRNRCEIAADSFIIAAKLARNHFAIVLQSLFFCVIESMYNRCTITTHSLRNYCATTAQSHCNRFAIAS
jgi:hypothetical protein